MRSLIALLVLLLPALASAQQWKAGATLSGWQSDSMIAKGGTVDQTGDLTVPYNMHRWGTFALSIPVTAGSYTVKLHFREPWLTAGQRVFHIDLEGARVETSLDVAALIGSGHLVRTYTADVTDGQLTVAFIDTVADDPMYSAIEVAPATGPVPPDPIPPTVATGSLTVRWTPPTKNTDGSPLTDLAGYRIYYGNTPTDLSRTATVSSPLVAIYLLDGLAAGTWYVAMTAYNSAGASSDLSTTASATVAAPIPACTAPKPPDQTRPVPCTAPLLGEWQQTLTHVQAEYPTCWAPSAWLPAVAPDGECTTAPTVAIWVVADVTSGSRPVYEPVLDAAGTATVRGTVQGSIAVGKPCTIERYRVGRNSYRTVAEADLTLASPTYRGREHTAICTLK